MGELLFARKTVKMRGMEQISSVQNERVKRVVRLQRKAAERRKEGLTVIEGEREVRRAMENGWMPQELWTCPELACGTAVWPVSGERICCTQAVFKKISYREGPDGVLAVGPLVGRSLQELRLPPAPLLLVIEGVEKPGNLGALLRTADGAGVDAVIVCDPATDLNNPNVVRASLGTLFYLPVAEASSAETLFFLRQRGIAVVAADPDAALPYTRAELSGPLAIVVGAEDTGLSPGWKEGADLAVRIPMLGKNDSLNVSVSAAVLLYEALRQRGGGGSESGRAAAGSSRESTVV